MKGPTKAEFVSHELARLGAINDLPALFEAVQLCDAYKEPLPAWATQKILPLISAAFEVPAITESDVGSSTRGRFNMDLTHFRRWATVESILRRESLAILPAASRGRPQTGEVTKQSILREASQEVNCSPRQIEASWRLVDKSRREGSPRFDFEAFFALEFTASQLP